MQVAQIPHSLKFSYLFCFSNLNGLPEIPTDHIYRHNNSFTQNNCPDHRSCTHFIQNLRITHRFFICEAECFVMFAINGLIIATCREHRGCKKSGNKNSTLNHDFSLNKKCENCSGNGNKKKYTQPNKDGSGECTRITSCRNVMSNNSQTINNPQKRNNNTECKNHLR